MKEITHLRIRTAILTQKPKAEKVRFRNGEIHIYGQIPNTNQDGWYFFGYVQDVEIKGLAGIGLEED